MDPVRFGAALRALRRHRKLTQRQLATKVGVSQSAVSRAERGDVRALTVGTVELIASGLGASSSLRLYFRGEELDRLLDAAHAGLVDRVIAILRSLGWDVVPEVTFNHFGERGSIDVLAFHPQHGALLVVEVKSVVPDMQAMLAGIDRKGRLAADIGRQRGWAVQTVSRLLVLPDDRTARRRLDAVAGSVHQVLPLRTREVRRWFALPDSAMGGVMFLAGGPETRSRHRVASRQADPGTDRRSAGHQG